MTESTVEEGQLLWSPSLSRIGNSRIARYLEWLARSRASSFANYADLHAFSTQQPAAFWLSIWDYFEVQGEPRPDCVLQGKLPTVSWCPGVQLNYAQHALRRRDDHAALIVRSERGARRVVSYAELAELVGRARRGLQRLGVRTGDRVAALVPSSAEAVVLFLASASLGAIWSSCSPEFGVSSVLDRFQQIEPRVLLAVDGYVYGGKHFDRRDELARIRAALPSLQATVLLGSSGVGVVSWDELLSEAGELVFEAVPFEHPLWILYSSGTTGLPKAIVHGHGGILLEHLKALALHCDLSETDRFFWFSTTGWMMWNMLVGGLLLGTTVVLYDGSPAYPDLHALWRLVEEEGITYFGVSAPYLLACRKAGIVPNAQHTLSSLRAVGTTGAPLPADGFGWVYEAVGRDLLLASISGGTDVCTAFVLSCPLLPVHAGEIQCAALGARVEAYNELGEPVVGEVGELVLTEPLPSMPLFFWNDAANARRLESYFSTYPGVWRHGDWVRVTERKSFVISGRSDSTLNRGGVRMGTSEFYALVEAMPEIVESLVVDTGSLVDATGTLWLFVVLKDGGVLDAALQGRIRDMLRRELSPRHVPDEIRQVSGVPRTLNGKKLEVPIKRILLGTPPDKAVSRDTLSNPDVLDAFLALAPKPSKL
ncbi:MAG TPA: acetoacetate--CoA ligase [Polyangiaceae bacterium]|nr:acetoacetate--CoA ligase [Polyangiaceae bacterium]